MHTAKLMKNIFALDLGTTKFCLATLREVPGREQPIVETISVPAEGMRRGMLANVQQAKVALQSLLETAEKQWQTDIGKVVVGVAGSHLQSRIVTASSQVEGATIAPKDLQKLIEKVEAQQISDTRELLHTVPIGYRIDDRETIEDPLGFSGRTLTGDFFLIDADKFYLKDIVEICNDTGLQVVRLYSEPFASASVTVPDSHKQLGVALGDIGGGTTDGIVFKNGRPMAAFTVNVAGKLMTSDIAIGLNIAPEDAEMAKIRFGLKPRVEDAVEVRDVRGQTRLLSGAQVTPILGARIHELCGLMMRELVRHRGTLGAGVLLTGGGADVKGIAEYFQSKMGVPVGKARPVFAAEAGTASIASEDAIAKSQHPTKHATVLGLLNLELGRMKETGRHRKNSWTSRYLGQLVNWIKELS